jgi:hypothetical protein
VRTDRISSSFCRNSREPLWPESPGSKRFDEPSQLRHRETTVN